MSQHCGHGPHFPDRFRCSEAVRDALMERYGKDVDSLMPVDVVLM
jgi:hypothetical protein